MKWKLYENLSGNEVYYTKSLILLAKNMLYSKIHYQKGFNLNPFLYKIVNNTDLAREDAPVLPKAETRNC